jgi:predicted transposase YbfD/YdcC
LRSANFLGGVTHLVELYATGDRLVLAVEKVPDKTVEKSTLPYLLSQVDVNGAIISGDAHFTAPESATQIVNSNADYLLAVKGNQPNLQAEMENFFRQAHEVEWEGVEDASYAKTIEKDHGRIETREVRAVQGLDWLPQDQKEKWKNLTSLVEVKSVREWVGSGKKKETATRYYISSRNAKASSFCEWIREHWSIENNVHWVADVIFVEDKAQTDIGHSAENLGAFRRLAMNMASSIDPQRGMASVRRAAKFGCNYLKGVLSKVFLSKKSVKNF